MVLRARITTSPTILSDNQVIVNTEAIRNTALRSPIREKWMPDRLGILKRWVEYFDEFLNNQNFGELEVPPTEDDGQILPPPRLEETVRAIHRLKNHISPGADGITAELVKYGGDQLQQVVLQLVLKVWDGESMPDN